MNQLESIEAKVSELHTDAPDVTIIVLVWNAKDLVLKCLKSIEDQKTRFSIRVIVVDNASTDGVDILISERFPKINLIRNISNLGFAAGNNVGIRKASGRFICLLNSDTEILPGCIDALVSFMDSNPRIGLCSPQGINEDGTIRKSCKRFPSLWNQFCASLCLNRLRPNSSLFIGRHMINFDHLETKSVEVLPGSFWITRRTAVDEVGMLDEKYFFYSEDIDWCKRFREKSWDIVFYAGAKFVHHHKGSSRKDPVFFHVQQYRSALQYWRKHHRFISVIVVRGLMAVHEIGRLVVNICRWGVVPRLRISAGLLVKCNFQALLYLLLGREFNSKSVN